MRGVRARNIGAGEISRGRVSMKHRIIDADLRNDLEVTVIALGAVVALAMIGFAFNLVIAPF
jgi:hypothetical protein